jgi:lysophospholipase L1-like esterase
MPRLPFALVAFVLLAPWRALAGVEPGHNFAQWENEVAAYEAQDRASPPPQGALLFAGSSTIRMWTTLAADFPGHAVINRGFGGTEIVDSTHFADRLIFPHAPKVIYLRAGTNDIHNGKSTAQVFADFKEFVAVIHAHLPKTDIWYIASNPTIARLTETAATHELNRLVKRYARWKWRVHYLDAETVSLDAAGRVRPEIFREDTLHFNAAGYKLLAERVRPYVR